MTLIQLPKYKSGWAKGKVVKVMLTDGVIRWPIVGPIENNWQPFILTAGAMVAAIGYGDGIFAEGAGSINRQPNPDNDLITLNYTPPDADVIQVLFYGDTTTHLNTNALNINGTSLSPTMVQYFTDEDVTMAMYPGFTMISGQSYNIEFSGPIS